MIKRFMVTATFLLSVTVLPLRAENLQPIEISVIESSAADHFQSLYEVDIEEPDILLEELFSEDFDIRFLEISGGPYVMRFSSIYMENRKNGTLSTLLLFSGGETRNQLVTGKVQGVSLLDNGDLRVDILVEDTRGFQDAPDYTEYTTRTAYVYIIGIDKEDRLCLRDVEISEPVSIRPAPFY